MVSVVGSEFIVASVEIENVFEGVERTKINMKLR